MHTLDAGDLAEVYPRFGAFVKMRNRLDPNRVFANDYLRRVLGD
jgi:L-gulonolactone oxidase